MSHIHKNIDYTVEVFIVYNNKVLLRIHDKLGIWLSVGEHIELDEDPNEAAIREVKEEVGLDIVLDRRLLPLHQEIDDIKELIPPYFLNRCKYSPTHEHVTFVYFATAQTDKISEAIEQEKSKESRWFTKKEIEENKEILANIKFYALKALSILSQ